MFIGYTKYVMGTGNIIQCHLMLGFDLLNLLKTGDRFSTQLAKVSIDPKVVELTADVVTNFQ